MIVFTLFLASLHYLTSADEYHFSIKDQCPSQESISKCSCNLKYGGIHVICSQLDSDKNLQDHLKGLKGYILERLRISRYNASTIPTDSFSGLEVAYLSLENVEVEDASFRRGKLHFRGLEESLRGLEITKSFRVGDRPLLNLKLDHLKNLQEVILEDNNIPEIGNDWFPSGPEKLSILIFERNNIEELGDRAFSSLSNLKLLAVAGNHINSISRSMLPKTAHRLTTLDLANNKIRSLPVDIFSEMPSLQDINLERNLIHLIKQDTWSSVFSQLVALKLEGNVLQCDEELKWICQTKMPKDIHGVCSSPQEKKGLRLKQFCN